MYILTHLYTLIYSCRPIGFQFWIGYVVPIGLIYVFNCVVFIVIVCSIFRQQTKMSGATGNKKLQLPVRSRLVISFTLSILFGLGWGIGLATTSSIPINFVRYSLQIIFVLLTSFQGLYIFIAYGLRLKKVRLTWLKWFLIIIGQHDKALSLASHDTLRLYGKNSQSHCVRGSFGDPCSDAVELKQFTKVKPLNHYSHRSRILIDNGTHCKVPEIEISVTNGEKNYLELERSPLSRRRFNLPIQDTKNTSPKLQPCAPSLDCLEKRTSFLSITSGTSSYCLDIDTEVEGTRRTTELHTTV